MIIKIINSADTYKRLLEIFKNHPKLTYEDSTWGSRPNHNNFSEEDKLAYQEVSDTLRRHIAGFRSFTNFQSINGEPKLRFEYNWTSEGWNENGSERYSATQLPFTGVGYLWLDELKLGFRKQ